MKMILRLIATFGLVFSLYGCLHEKYDKCPLDPEQANITFHLSDGKGGCKFLQNVLSVELEVYDADSNRVEARHLSSADLALNKGVSINLTPGKYYILAWGNVGDNIVKKGVDTDYPYFTYKEIIGGRVGQSDRLFYAPLAGTGSASRAMDMQNSYQMTVNPKTGHTGTLEFGYAHRTINVYIEGFNSTGGAPKVEFENVPAGLYCHTMSQIKGSGDTKQVVTTSRLTSPTTKESVTYDHAEFTTFCFDNDNEIVIKVIDPSPEAQGAVIYAESLNDILQSIGGTLDSDEVEISIVLKFSTGGVEVTLPKWDRGEIVPEL